MSADLEVAWRGPRAEEVVWGSALSPPGDWAAIRYRFCFCIAAFSAWADECRHAVQPTHLLGEMSIGHVDGDPIIYSAAISATAGGMRIGILEKGCVLRCVLWGFRLLVRGGRSYLFGLPPTRPEPRARDRPWACRLLLCM